jgi:hypothetical protein
MATLVAAALALVVPFVFSGEREEDAVRPVDSFPKVEIAKADSVHEWPFSVERGDLTCVAMGGQKVVIFSEPWRTDVPQEFGNMTPPRSVIMSTNPLALFASLEDRALYAPFDSLETLIRRLAPFETMGLALCAKDGATPQIRDL